MAAFKFLEVVFIAVNLCISSRKQLQMGEYISFDFWLKVGVSSEGRKLGNIKLPNSSNGGINFKNRL